MKIYTRTGDDGGTGLFGGARVDKDDPRVEVYGTIDETSAAIGLARSGGLSATLDAILERIQHDLFQLGAELACAPGQEHKLRVPRIAQSEIAWLEACIDEQEAFLPKLRQFVLPSGALAAAALHLARTICRRAERRLVEGRRRVAVRDATIVYLNRLSDLLFVLARRCNQEAKVPDSPWIPPTDHANP